MSDGLKPMRINPGMPPGLTPTIGAVVDTHGPIFDLFKKGERNTIIRTALGVAGDYWLDEYLPLRWIAGYARKLGYSHRDRDPLLSTGALRKLALANAKAVARSTAKNQTLTIRIPYPGYVRFQPIVSLVLRTLPASEVGAITRVFEREVILILEGATYTRTKRGKNAGQTKGTIKGASSSLASSAQHRARKAALNRQLDIRGRDNSQASSAARVQARINKQTNRRGLGSRSGIN